MMGGMGGMGMGMGMGGSGGGLELSKFKKIELIRKEIDGGAMMG